MGTHYDPDGAEVVLSDRTGNPLLVVTHKGELQAVPDITFAQLVNVGGPRGTAIGRRLSKRVLDLAPGVATPILRVTIPNKDQVAAIKILFITAHPDGAGVFASARVGEGMVVVARAAGGLAEAVRAPLEETAIVNIGHAHSLAYNVTPVSGGLTEPQWFDITATMDDAAHHVGNRLGVLVDVMSAGDVEEFRVE